MMQCPLKGQAYVYNFFSIYADKQPYYHNVYSFTGHTHMLVSTFKRVYLQQDLVCVYYT